MADTRTKSFTKLISLHYRISGLHPALEKLYPVAVVEDGQLLIYDLEGDKMVYQRRAAIPSPMPIPIGVRAAFQLEGYGGRIACVVTPEVFDTLSGYATIFHEFVHCYQYETCEQSLKMRLDVARQALDMGNFMWEIDHPFPYQSKNFIQPYTQFLDAAAKNDLEAVHKTRTDLRAYLGLHDYEYMVWQEWKEGFARWVENLIKPKLKLPKNKGGQEKPYSRVLFYAGGEAYINLISQHHQDLVLNLPALFAEMYTPGAG